MVQTEKRSLELSRTLYKNEEASRVTNGREALLFGVLDTYASRDLGVKKPKHIQTNERQTKDLSQGRRGEMMKVA